MHAEHTVARKLYLLLGAVLLAAPIHAQTLQASASQVTIGEVLNCNDTQTITLTSSGAAITLKAAITYAAGDTHGTWLYVTNTATNVSTDSSTPITISVPSGGSVTLKVGLNVQIGVNDTANVTLTTTSPTGQTINIPVTDQYTLACTPLTVNNGILTAIPASLSLSAAQGQSVTQDVVIYNISTSPVTFTVNPGSFFPWISTSSGTITLAPGQQVVIPVTLSAAGLTPGTYSGSLLVNWGSATNLPLSINVTLTVTSNGVGPGITTGVAVSSNAVNFTWVPGGHPLQSQTVQVTNQVGTNPIPFTVSAVQFNGPPNWLSTNYTSGTTTPFTLAIGANTSSSSLVPGVTYQGTVTITPYLGPAVEIYVSLAVAAAPVVSASPASLTFNATQGGAAPPAQTVIVTGAGNVVDYSTVAIIPGWLSAFPATGSAPNGTILTGVAPGGGSYLNINVNPAGLTAGTYTGTVTVYGDGPAVGQTNISVTLNVAGPAVHSVTNSASFSAAAVAPGEMVTLFADAASAFGPTAGVPLTDDLIVNNMLPTNLGGVQVFFNGVAAPMIYASATQINAVVPYEIAGASDVQMTVKYGDLITAPVAMKAASTQPALFTATATGIGQGAIGQYDARGNYLGMNSSSNPVTRGNVITLYVTGEGKTQAAVTGLITSAQSTAPYTPQPMVPPAVLIDGQPATVLFYGEVPGVVAGMMQVNVAVPLTARTGDGIPVSISMGSGYSQAGVTMSVR